MSFWFTPVCDDLLRTIAIWYASYERGDVESDRKWLNLDGVIVNRPTRYAHQLTFKPIELVYLVRIMTALAPKSEVTAEVTKLQAGLRRGQLLPGGAYRITVAYWKEDIQEILEALVRAKRGETEPFDLTLEKQKRDGKELFEV